MSKGSLAVYQVMRGCMIHFLFALACLQVAQANAACGCESTSHSDECSSDRLQIISVLNVGLLTLDDNIEIEVTPFLTLPCGITRYGKTEFFSVTSTTGPLTLKPIQTSFSDDSGAYFAGVNISSVSTPSLENVTFSLTNLVSSTSDEPTIVAVGSDRKVALEVLPPGMECIDFQVNNFFVYSR